MKKVVILRVEDYNREILKERIRLALKEHFNLPKLFNRADKIVLKPNFLMPAQPEEAITTHPLFIEAVAEIFQEMGNAIFIADSPGGFVNNLAMDLVYEKTGIKPIAQRHDFKLLYPTQSVIVDGIPLCWWAKPRSQENADFKMINLAKLKTHDVMVLTLAVKNLYGCISGLYKSHLHTTCPKTKDFSEVILKLYEMIKPELNIVDGILALEGNGPAKRGRPKKLGLVIIGDDALYTDYAISKIIGLKDRDNPLLAQAKAKGLLGEELTIVSDLTGPIKNFDLPDPFIVNRIPSPLLNLIMPLFSFKPAINQKQCRLCGKCVEVCPKQAISFGEARTLHIDYKQCIMCMCCSEMCPHAAVDVAHSGLIKLIRNIYRCFQ